MGSKTCRRAWRDTACFVPTEYEEDERAMATQPPSNAPSNEEDESKVSSKTNPPVGDEEE